MIICISTAVSQAEDSSWLQVVFHSYVLVDPFIQQTAATLVTDLLSIAVLEM